jgi:anti-sigma regulatory factor (Ser/Thr protein kinase)
MSQSSWDGPVHIDRIGMGDHACQFYRTAQDLAQTLIPYFKTGLERNEACVWVTARPYPAERALSELRVAVPDIDQRIATGQLQIYSYDEWYLKYSRLGMDELVRVWLARKNDAVASGYAGLRISGNGSFVTPEAWPAFMDYEKAFDTASQGQLITTLCSYWLDTCEADAVFDVLRCHSCGWSKHRDRWEETVIVTGSGRARPALARNQQGTFEIMQLMEKVLRTHAGKVRLQGEPMHLSHPQAVNLGVIITELVANAAKHGALAKPEGEVCVQWHAIVNGSRRLQVLWTESGMSTFAVPEKIGAGTHLLAGVTENFERTFEAGGMSCAFELSLDGDGGPVR